MYQNQTVLDLNSQNSKQMVGFYAYKMTVSEYIVWHLYDFRKAFLRTFCIVVTALAHLENLFPSVCHHQKSFFRHIDSTLTRIGIRLIENDGEKSNLKIIFQENTVCSCVIKRE